MWSRALGVAFVLSACSGISGCYSRATAYDGKFTFGYASGVEIENFVKPIAPGAKLDVVVFANGTSKKLKLTKAVSSKPSIVTIEKVSGDVLTLTGASAGVSEIEVTATSADGTTLTDKMFFHVAKPVTHKIEHACTEAADATYVRGDDVDVFHRLATSDNRPVVGYDYAPLRVEPARALDLVAQPQGASMYRFRAKAVSPRITIKSTIDDKELGVRIIERGDLTEAHLDFDDRMIEGDMRYAVANVVFGDAALCSQNALTKAKSLTPEICHVTARLEDEPAEENRWQLARIDATKFGVCKFEVTLPELRGGKGVVLSGEVKIGTQTIRYPGESGGVSWLDWVRTALTTREAFGVVVLGAWLFVRRRRRAS